MHSAWKGAVNVPFSLLIVITSGGDPLAVLVVPSALLVDLLAEGLLGHHRVVSSGAVLRVVGVAQVLRPVPDRRVRWHAVLGLVRQTIEIVWITALVLILIPINARQSVYIHEAY
jgi:hypothetical protein